MKKAPLSIIDFCRDPQLLNLSLSPAQTVLLTAIYGMALGKDERGLYAQWTGRATYQAGRSFAEVTVVAGARSGKDSRIAAPVVLYEAIWGGHDRRLAKGECGVIALVAQDKDATRVAFTYIRGLELVRKQLELLKEIVPKVRRVAILSNPANPFHAFATRDVKGAARSLGVQLQLLEARGPTEFDGAFAAMVKERVGALVIVPDQMFQLHRIRLADLVARSRLPAAYGLREYVEAGGLLSYGTSLPDL